MKPVNLSDLDKSMKRLNAYIKNLQEVTIVDVPPDVYRLDYLDKAVIERIKERNARINRQNAHLETLGISVAHLRGLYEYMIKQEIAQINTLCQIPEVRGL